MVEAPCPLIYEWSIYCQDLSIHLVVLAITWLLVPGLSALRCLLMRRSHSCTTFGQL